MTLPFAALANGTEGAKLTVQGNLCHYDVLNLEAIESPAGSTIYLNRENTTEVDQAFIDDKLTDSMKELCAGKKVFTSNIVVSDEDNTAQTRQFQGVCRTLHTSCGWWGPIVFTDIWAGPSTYSHYIDTNRYCSICNDDNQYFVNCTNLDDQQSFSTACKFYFTHATMTKILELKRIISRSINNNSK